MRSVIILLACITFAGCTAAQRQYMAEDYQRALQDGRLDNFQGYHGTQGNDLTRYHYNPQNNYQTPNTNQSPTWGTQNQQRNVTCYRATDGILRCWE